MVHYYTQFCNMDVECLSLLPRVCEVLADSGRSLPDDTSLEKLLDWFTMLTKTGGSLLESCPCLTGFISTVIGNKDSDHGVLSFTLKLTGLIAATEDGFKSLQESLLLNEAFKLQHWQEAGLWDDPCIRIGWIQGLKSLLQHSKALNSFAQSDFIEPLLQLQTDSSLFVASAANQLLAHILLFFQPVLSERYNGEGKLNGIKSASSEQPAIPMEASTEYTAFVKLISEYLRESLIPTDNKQLHQSLQSLKLLALLLHQARPALQDELLQTVTGSLEEAVKSGCSELTLPLMDVILAAYRPGSERVPDQHVGRLLSSMLNINKPSDLIQAAAAFLRSGLHDARHSVQAVRMLLLPLDIVTGHTLLGTNTSVEDHGSSMAEQLKSKTSCISLICICLTHTPHITLLPSDILPCPPAVIVTAVLSLLRICSGVSPPSSSGCSEACRNVISCSKVQKCALEALISLSSSQGAQEKISEVFASLIEYLDNPDSEPTVLHKSYQALLKWISVCTDISCITDQFRQDLAGVVKKRVCDMRWEMRDSSVEFLGHLANIGVPLKLAKEMCNVTEALLGGCSTTPLLREALQDTESYVRASAVSALAKTMAHSWQQGAALSQEETEIVSRLLEILSDDTEGFSRRAVVQYFISWFSSSSSSSPLLKQSVRCVLSQGSADLDWEVKFHTLELAELLMDDAFSGQRGYRKDSDTHDAPQHPYGVVSEQTFALHTHTVTEEVGSDVGRALKTLVEQGVVCALLSGLVDCDRPVGLKACRLLITLREMVCSLLGGQDVSGGTVSRVSCELPEQGWGREIRKLLGDKKAQETDTLTEGAAGEACAVDVCELLRSLGLEEKRDVLTQSSDHIHNSPLSLLQDILTVRVAHSHSDAETQQEVIVDCY